MISATSAAACSATGSRSGSMAKSMDSAWEVMSSSRSAHMTACLVFSASGPNTRVVGTTRSLSCETGAPQNGRKQPARNRTPRALPCPSSRRTNSDRSTP